MKEREEKERKYLFCIILLEGFEVIPYEISKFRLSQNFLDCSCMCLISIEVVWFLFSTHLVATVAVTDRQGAWYYQAKRRILLRMRFN